MPSGPYQGFRNYGQWRRTQTPGYRRRQLRPKKVKPLRPTTPGAPPVAPTTQPVARPSTLPQGKPFTPQGFQPPGWAKRGQTKPLPPGQRKRYS